MNMNTSSPIIVIGMHRSGTSLVSRLLSELDVQMGKELDSNHESVCFKKINMQLLKDQGAHWAKPDRFVRQLHNQAFVKERAEKAWHLLMQNVSHYGQIEANQQWGWKDPRTTLTLPVWLVNFPDARVIHVVRNGIDVALSLHRREIRRYFQRVDTPRMFPPTILAGYELWKRYLEIGRNLELQCQHWLSLRYEDLISEPEKHTRCLCDFAQVPVSEEQLKHVAARIVRKPTERSRLDTLRLQLYVRLTLIDPRPLVEMGYSLPASQGSHSVR